ncbi:hypothetical protein [Streptomyces sp. NPDC001851]|uniref:hypothetical protein n=1 Tax=Streptomyces sp. NPDC001851 TaxID=3154529 RepID=UPI00332AD456
MTTLLPWLEEPLYRERLATLLSDVADAPLAAVRYVAPSGGTWPEGHRADRGAHEVDMAVALTLGNGWVLAASWAMDGLNEGLALELTEPGDTPDLSGTAVDVSGRAEWSEFLGMALTGITPVTHVPNEGCPEMPWAVRLDFSAAAPVTVALGESTGSGFTYMPDSLVVIFDEKEAAAYRIPASSEPALGHR